MSSDLIPIRTVLISVTNKEGLKGLIKTIQEDNPELQVIATDGSFRYLKDTVANLQKVSAITQFPECFEGRVKTLHPKLFGGILAREGQETEEAKTMGMPVFDMVVCNLYDFDSARQEKSLDLEKLFSFMDIGGSALIRSSVKNSSRVAIVSSPEDYPAIEAELKAQQGALSQKTRRQLALKAITLSANYEAMIAETLAEKLEAPPSLRPRFVDVRPLRYGENPDQKGWFVPLIGEKGLGQATVLSGKPLSYNNYEDASAAHKAISTLKLLFPDQSSAAIIKHGSICGMATAPQAAQAFNWAWDGDPLSAFGGILGLTDPANETLIPLIEKKFIEVIAAPSFSEDFLAYCKEKKKNLRLLQIAPQPDTSFQFKHISGGMLVQTAQKFAFNAEEFLLAPAKEVEGFRCGVVTQAFPEKDKTPLYRFAIATLGLAKSNTISLSREVEKGYYQLLAIGAGQPNRIDCLKRLALPKAQEKEPDLSECVLASDGFFPFDDTIRLAAEYGIRHVLQPGGGKRDDEVIQAANENRMTMVFTGQRYFTH